MAIVVKLISDYAPWVYAACALVALWYLRVAFQARSERKQAAFSLERDAALSKTYQGLSVSIFLFITIGVVYFVSTSLNQAVQPLVEAVVVPTPTPFVFPTATPTLEPATPTPTSVVATPTKRPTPNPTATQSPPTPTTIAIVAPNCGDPRAQITRPGVNQAIQGTVQVIGSASSDQFDYYKLEYKPTDAQVNPTFILSNKQSVSGGVLGAWNVNGLKAGNYLLYLRTVDITGNFGECVVQVRVGA